MNDISYENLGDKLIEAVPELSVEYETLLKWWGGEKPGQHNIYGDVLNPSLLALLETSGDDEILERIFVFLEKLANHPDVHIQEVVAFTVCERLIDDPKLLAKARKYMGRKTLRFSYEVEKFWSTPSLKKF